MTGVAGEFALVNGGTDVPPAGIVADRELNWPPRSGELPGAAQPLNRRG